jgi:beta-N-acetylglucosaminidase
MYNPYRKRRNQKPFAVIAVSSLVTLSLIGNICIKNITDNKPIEAFALDTLTGKAQLQQLHKQNEVEYQSRIDTLQRDIDELRKEKVSRGAVERAEQLKKERVIQAIKNNLGGVFKGKAEYIYTTAKQFNVNPMLVTAIIRHETGNGTSKMCINDNNPGGITNNSGFAKYPTLEDGIWAMCKLLKVEYIDKGRDSIETIGAKYCPIGAKNDPTGINKYWIPLVTKYYEQIQKEAR